MKERGIRVECQAPLLVEHKGRQVGEYYADVLADDQLILELKSVEEFASEHLAQCINYLKATGIRMALLVNFKKPEAEWKRIVL